MVSLGDHADNEVDSDKLERELSSDSQPQVSQEVPCGINESKSDQKCTATATATKPLEVPVKQPDASIEQLEKEGSISIIATEKVIYTPIPLDQYPHSDLKGSSTSIIREKVSEDGYNWRKYGQKLVKGSAFVRSYYRCTHPTCIVKKQLERTHSGKLTDTVYFGQHDHAKPQPHVPVTVGVTVVEEKRDEHTSGSSQDKITTALGQTPHQTEPVDVLHRSTVTANGNVKDETLKRSRISEEVDSDDVPDLKREKKRCCNIDVTVADKSTIEPRVVVQTPSEVDIVNDGYRWRKYGQKLVKGNPNPRSYYRCSSPGCPVKKHVERASHDPKVVLTTYEGQHDHDMPPARTVTLNPVGPGICTSVHNSEIGSKSDGSSISHDMVVRTSSDSRGNSSSEGNLIEKKHATETSDGIVLDMMIKSSPGVVSEQQNQQLKVAIES